MSELVTNVCTGKSIVLSVSTESLLAEPRSVVDRELLPHEERSLSEQRQAFLCEEEEVARIREVLVQKERYVAWNQLRRSI
jgi:hypothetical protein